MRSKKIIMLSLWGLVLVLGFVAYQQFEPVNAANIVIQSGHSSNASISYTDFVNPEINGFPQDSLIETNAISVIPQQAGFGIYTPAGRGGKIFRVTNLRDRGPGSLREALEYKGPRTVIFEISGVIDLKDRIEISEPYLTIAGQTAPGQGICIRGSLIILTHDILVQHLAIRQWPGEDYTDCLSIGYGGGYPTHNIVIDHCSLTFGKDETMEISLEDDQDVTISNCIISRAEYNKKDCYGALWGATSPTARIASIGNLFSHNRERAPLASVSMFYANNVIYDQYERQISLEADNLEYSLPFQIVIAGNVFAQKNGEYGNPPIHFAGNWNNDAKIYVAQNFWSEKSTVANAYNDWWNTDFMYLNNLRRSVIYKIQAKKPTIDLPDFKMLTDKEEIMTNVKNNVGPRPWNRHPFDQEIVDDFVNGVGERGRGVEFPYYQEVRAKHILPENPLEDTDENGYSQLEDWIHQFSSSK